MQIPDVFTKVASFDLKMRLKDGCFPKKSSTCDPSRLNTTYFTTLHWILPTHSRRYAACSNLGVCRHWLTAQSWVSLRYSTGNGQNQQKKSQLFPSTFVQMQYLFHQDTWSSKLYPKIGIEAICPSLFWLNQEKAYNQHFCSLSFYFGIQQIGAS